MNAPARSTLVVAIVLVILIGLASRLSPYALPPLVGKHLGDGLWSLMFYLIVLLIRPRTGVRVAAVVAFALACGTEFLKLMHVPWLDALRVRPALGFVLRGHFQWGNFVTYAIGVLAGVVVSLSWGRARSRTR